MSFPSSAKAGAFAQRDAQALGDTAYHLTLGHRAIHHLSDVMNGHNPFDEDATRPGVDPQLDELGAGRERGVLGDGPTGGLQNPGSAVIHH